MPNLAVMAGDGRIDFEKWVAEFRRAVDLGQSSDVPCHGCTACCRSAQFVHIEPDEEATLRRIDPALLVPAPGRPPGHWVMGYDEQGRCPMLGEDGCRIYEDRPRACRVYDCRVFAAVGVEPDQPLVAERVRRWVFLPDPGRRAVAERAVVLRAAGAGPVEAALRAVVGDPAQAGGDPVGRQPGGRTSLAMPESTPLTNLPDSSVE